ncbi:MAG: Hsp20/alpha crystallin family protein [Thermoplasmatota archaeon]
MAEEEDVDIEERKEGKGSELAERREDLFMNPFKEMETLFEDLDKTFDRFFGRPLMRKERGRQMIPSLRGPACDLRDLGDEYVCELDLPGMSKDDIEVEVREDSLRVKGEARKETKEEGEDYVRQERRYRSFNRELPMPEDVISEDAEATLNNGVLKVSLPKKEPEKKKGKKLEIK